MLKSYANRLKNENLSEKEFQRKLRNYEQNITRSLGLYTPEQLKEIIEEYPLCILNNTNFQVINISSKDKFIDILNNGQCCYFG